MRYKESCVTAQSFQEEMLMPQTYIMHIDVNNAFLSWTAHRRLTEDPNSLDLRTVPSIVGGDQEKRHGIVLAKSMSAKAYGIQTGEPIVHALKKCPQLLIVPPEFSTYVTYSDLLMHLLTDYTDHLQQFSIDEAWIEYTGMEQIYGSPEHAAYLIKDRVEQELGFTVNIGVSTNKLLAKMASDFQKPNRVHTLFPNEIATKMWPLPVGDLFFVGRATQKRLETLGIHTIGELANTDPSLLRSHFKKQGDIIWNYANGIDLNGFGDKNRTAKSYGNSTTIAYDVTDPNYAKVILLSLCETVATRLRMDQALPTTISVTITDCNFVTTSHQKTMSSPTNVTNEIYYYACQLFDELWDASTPIRLLGVSTGKLSNNEYKQLSLFEDPAQHTRLRNLDCAIDSIRSKYGDTAVVRGCFLNAKDSEKA